MKKYILSAFVVLFSLQSCREEYLNEPKPTDKLAPETVFSSVDGATAYLSGILRHTRNQYTSTDSGNLASMYFARTVKGNDFIVSSNWFNSDYSNTNREANYRRPNFTWTYLYDLINKVNIFIDGVNNSKTISDSDKAPLLAQALTMRAYFYFELSLEFQHTYLYDTSLPVPPIYKTPNEKEGHPMSTQKELYNFIVSDLTSAIEKGSTNRINKSYYNKTVTYAIAARVYQVMGEWSKAADCANKAYGGTVNSALSASSYKNGFDNMDNNIEWILALPQQSDQSAYYWTAPFAFIDIATKTGYKNTFVNKSLVNLFSDTDVRKLFSKTSRTDWAEYYTTKFKFSFSAHIPLIRTPEMILIEAEAYYHLGNTDKAHELLFALQSNRDSNAQKSSNTGENLLNEILLERRKELYGEIGVEWYDAKRLRKGITRDSWHKEPLTNNPLKKDDKRFFLKIPQEELNANPNIPSNINDNR